MNRLETISPELAAQLALATEEQRRVLVLAACRSAVQESGLDNDGINAALASMQQRQPMAADGVARITAIAQSLDDMYLAMEEGADEARVSSDRLMQFSQARAAFAVAYGVQALSLQSDMEAIYEAAMAVESPADAARALLALL